MRTVMRTLAERHLEKTTSSYSQTRGSLVDCAATFQSESTAIVPNACAPRCSPGGEVFVEKLVSRLRTATFN